MRLIFFYFVPAILLLICLQDTAHAIKWLSLGKDRITWDGRARQAQCHSRTLELTRGQAKICRTKVEVMPYVSKAAEQSLKTCQQLFQTRRWNCATALLTPNYSPDLKTGTREQSFVYALSSASLVYVISKACASHQLFNCSCSAHPRETPESNFKWGGCGDNVRWAVQFAKRFTDSADRRLLKGKGTPKSKRGSVEPSADLGAVMIGTGSFSRIFSKTQLALVNLHNTRAGRKEIEKSLKTQCACHGVSGSCTFRSCWKGLPKFYEIGESLQKKHAAAVEVSVKTFGVKREMEQVRRDAKSLTADQLVYVTKSPDYCLRDDKTGSLGTLGRYCNETSQGYDSCDVMCCGRGYTSLMIKKIERCDCTFRWCCEVICKQCLNWIDQQICN